MSKGYRNGGLGLSKQRRLNNLPNSKLRDIKDASLPYRLPPAIEVVLISERRRNHQTWAITGSSSLFRPMDDVATRK